MANIHDARTIRKLEEQKRREEELRGHEHCERDLRRSNKVESGEVVRCDHGAIYLISKYHAYFANDVVLLTPTRHPFLYRRAVRSLRLEEEIARREEAAGVPESEGEGA